MQRNDQTIAVIGLGRMGSALAARLAGQGWRTVAWSRSSAPGATPEGYEICGTLAMAAARAEMLVLSLFDDAAVRDVVGALCQTDLTGKLIVDTSTVSPGLLTELMPQIRAAHGSAMDAPISGAPDAVRAGQATVFAGGSDQDMARLRPVAHAFAARVTHMGALGQGMIAKVINNAMLACYFQALRETIGIGIAAGMPADKLMTILSEGPSANAIMKLKKDAFMGRDDTVAFTVAGIVKDGAVFTGAARDLGVDAPALRAAIKSFEAVAARGKGDEDFSAVIRDVLGTDRDPIKDASRAGATRKT